MSLERESQLPHCFSCNDCGWQGSSFKATCPACEGKDIVEFETSRTGRIVDYVPILFPPDNLQDLGQYVSVLVKFDDGCRLFGILLEKPESVKIGSPVVISSFDRDSRKLVFTTV